MDLMTNMIILAIALATFANAAIITNTITFTLALETVAKAGFFTNTVTLTIALATAATAKPQNFTYLAIETRANDDCDETHVCYAVADDSGGDDRVGWIHGCLKVSIKTKLTKTIDDGIFRFALYDRVDSTGGYAASITEMSSDFTL